MITGCFAIFLIWAVSSSTCFASCPKARKPAFTLGQEILISIISMGSSARRSTTARYSSGAWPQTLTMIFVSNCFRNGISRRQKTSIPGFCRPMAFIMPPYTSATLGVGLPAQGTFATPLVVTAPSWFKSTNSENSSPDPNVPEATVTGFFHSTPAMLIFIFIRFPPPKPGIPGRPCRPSYYARCCARPFLCSCRRSPGMRRSRRPSALPEKYNIRYHFPGHTP